MTWHLPWKYYLHTNSIFNYLHCSDESNTCKNKQIMLHCTHQTWLSCRLYFPLLLAETSNWSFFWAFKMQLQFLLSFQVSQDCRSFIESWCRSLLLLLCCPCLFIAVTKERMSPLITFDSVIFVRVPDASTSLTVATMMSICVFLTYATALTT